MRFKGVHKTLGRRASRTTESRMVQVHQVKEHSQDPAINAKSIESPTQLPLKLIQPHLPEVNFANLVAYDPDLAELDLIYVRKSLVGVGHRMLAFYRSVHCDPPRSGVPKMMEISVNDGGLSLCPTHVVAVRTLPAPGPAPPPSDRPAIKLFPVHAIIFLAYCANMPPLPRPQPTVVLVTPHTGSSPVLSTLRIPVVQLPLPEPGAFLTIANFLYSMSLKPVRTACLPVQEPEPIPPYSAERVAAHIQRLTEGADLATLTGAMWHVYGVYQNLIALGLSDQRLWDYIRFAWETLTGAIRLLESQGFRMPEPMIPDP